MEEATGNGHDAGGTGMDGNDGGESLLSPLGSNA